jgi:hypothetical protein
MAKSTPVKKAKAADSKAEGVSKDMLSEYINDIAEKTLNADESKLHSVIALNQIFSDHDKVSLLDEEMKEQLRDIWLRIKGAGIELVDPPLLFGLPEDFSSEDSTT